MKTRKTVKIKCEQCRKYFKKYAHHLKYNKLNGHKTFCSTTCSNEYKKTGILIKCANCEKQVWKTKAVLKRSKSGKYFCSKHCATIVNNTVYKSAENNPNWAGGNSSYRKIALNAYGSFCRVCNYSIEAILEVHHIDGNRKNNKLENLMVLCPTHHKEIEYDVHKIPKNSSPTMVPRFKKR